MEQTISYLITVSRAHLLPAQMLLCTLQQKTDNPIVVVGNLLPNERQLIESFGIRYIDEDDIDYKGRLPHVTWKEKYRGFGWYKQMFIRLCCDTFIATDFVVILDSEVFFFDNWDEKQLFDPDTNHPRMFYWIPKERKPEWDYRMYLGAAYLLSFLPECKGISDYANSDEYQRHISGVVLFSTKNVKALWERLEQETDLKQNIQGLFSNHPEFAFSDHDFYGLAAEYGLFDDIVPTVMYNNLLGWFDNHNDIEFHKFKSSAMWSMCQNYMAYATPERYYAYMKDIANQLKRKLPEIPHYWNEDDTELLDTSFESMSDNTCYAQSEIALCIEDLVTALPEVYQPIYGHPELSQKISRLCGDRLEKILRIHDALAALLGRPLKVLDLGCAQGYFSFNLAQRGASVQGIDYLDNNIALCNTLARHLPEFDVVFTLGRIEDAVERIEPDQFDIILGLSVFHHIIHESGIEKVKALIDHIALQSGALITELALREEPLYWGPSQPQDPRTLLESMAFVFELGCHETHLAEIPRPLYLASNRYWIIDGQAGCFDSWSTEPHAFAQATHMGSRRYYFGNESILKFYLFDHRRGEHNRVEFARETQFLSHPPKAFPAPGYAVLAENDKEAWVRLQRLPGRLLLDLLREGVEIDRHAVLLAVLKQLASLEAAGLYHNDTRSWNVLATQNGEAHLIDYGAISPTPQDCDWPGNLFLSFFIFVREVTMGWLEAPNPLRTISISPFSLPEPYRTWANALWLRPMNEWSFKLMHDTLAGISSCSVIASPVLPAEVWAKAIEEALQVQKLFAISLKSRLSHIEELVVEQQQRNTAYEGKLRQYEEQLQQYDIKGTQAEMRIISLLNSTSWRITRPLRALKRMLGGDFSIPRRIIAAGTLKLKHWLRPALAHAIRFVFQRPGLASVLNRLLKSLPWLHKRLRRFAMNTGVVRFGSLSSSEHRPSMPPRVRQIYAALQAAIEDNRTGENQ